MIEGFYGILEAIGYEHPVHPIFVHFTVGLTVATAVFALIAWIGNRPQLYTTAKHTINFGIVMYVFTVLFGFADWIHFYSSAWILPIQMKVILAAVLLPLLVAAYYINRKGQPNPKILATIYVLAAIDVIVIAYFGAELVY